MSIDFHAQCADANAWADSQAILPDNAVRVTGTLTNRNDPADVRDVVWVAVYGGWRDDSPGSRTNGKIYSWSMMRAIVEQYPTLKVTTER